MSRINHQANEIMVPRGIEIIFISLIFTGPHSAVGNVSGYRCVSDSNSRGPEFDPSPGPYFRGD